MGSQLASRLKNCPTSQKVGLLHEDEVDSVQMLGAEGTLEWRRDDDEGLTITVPDKMPCEHAVTFKVNLK